MEIVAHCPRSGGVFNQYFHFNDEAELYDENDILFNWQVNSIAFVFVFESHD